ncbi:tRNA (adenosine(37)-N6)-dimethylallyltransferase MiaA [Bartonella tamiae]|uniref:tRNA (adenosine(37)-N6)-dimethylallyltransferase MiaA n=1 Tax=Bartonella tamiae TaxID=373638 RepID=UPI00026E7A6F|nr:tRNA (adenosine(37)-N6)-dimethylallyltransferase MiaA [Bartonella tamiae]EJF95104.1 tRNA dimethylallyltransferase [Bartonella tamiae Th307]
MVAKGSITLIAGPTASGKSDFALKLAEKTDAIIINADSMQIYDVLQIITARPALIDMKKIPHYLYGYIHPSVAYSTGEWMRDVKNIMKSQSHREIIFVGGTGLYFKALLEGIAEIPPVPEDIRQKWRKIAQEESEERLFALLLSQDAQTASRLKPQDRQRVTRALEVFEATGQSLSYWQDTKTIPIIDKDTAQKYLLFPERSLVYQRIEHRFDKMVARGALEEVRQLAQLSLNPQLPAMKAIGVPDLLDVLQNMKPLDEAIKNAKTQTRRYAKRQMTWFRHQFDQSWSVL